MIRKATRSPYLVDTTLRDGEQAAGVVFGHAEQRLIARSIAQIGVREIELPSPMMGASACGLIEDVLALQLSARVTIWSRALQYDIEQAADLVGQTEGRSAVASGSSVGLHLSLPVSELQLLALGKDRRWVLGQLQELVPLAAGRFGFVSVGLADSSRCEVGFLRVIARELMTLGANRLRLADTVGVWDPWSVELVLRELRDEVGDSLELGFHGHNDLGLATANALSALRAGADCVDVTVNGLGERAGNAALEEVVMAGHHTLGMDLGIVKNRLGALCDQVAAASGRAIHESKPIVGAGANRHESGIHVHGLLHDPGTYQAFDPAEVGRGPWELVIGKHSGKAAIEHSLAQRGVRVSADRAQQVLMKVKALAEQKGGAVSGDELVKLCG